MNSNKVLMGIRTINLVLYAGFVIFQVMSLSSWHYFFRGFTTTSGTIALGLLLAMTFLGFIFSWNVHRFVLTVLIIGILAVYFTIYGRQNEMFFILLPILAGVGQRDSNLIRVDFYVRLFTTGFVVVMSIIGLLPFSGLGAGVTGYFFTDFTMGFTYPNELGFLLLVLYVEYILFFSSLKYNKIRVATVTIIVLLLELYCDYATGMLAVLIAFLSYTFKGKISNFVLASANIVVAGSSLLFFLITAQKYNPASGFWIGVNNMLSNRAAIWQSYFQHFPINFIGNVIDMQDLNLMGHGAIDGGFFYLLLRYGLLSVIIVCIVFLLSIFKSQFSKHSKELLIFILTITVTLFTETLGIMSSYSPLFFLFGVILFSPKKTFLDNKMKNNSVLS